MTTKHRLVSVLALLLAPLAACGAARPNPLQPDSAAGDSRIEVSTSLDATPTDSTDLFPTAVTVEPRELSVGEHFTVDLTCPTERPYEQGWVVLADSTTNQLRGGYILDELPASIEAQYAGEYKAYVLCYLYEGCDLPHVGPDTSVPWWCLDIEPSIEWPTIRIHGIETLVAVE